MKDSLDLLNQWIAAKKAQGNFRIPARARPSHITLIGLDEKFDADFEQGLYLLELAMLEKNMNPDIFTIKKHRASPGAIYPGAADTNVILYGYGLVFEGHSYNVRRKSDMDFLAYFSNLMLSDEHDVPSETTEQRRAGFFSRIISWLTKDAF